MDKKEFDRRALEHLDYLKRTGPSTSPVKFYVFAAGMTVYAIVVIVAMWQGWV